MGARKQLRRTFKSFPGKTFSANNIYSFKILFLFSDMFFGWISGILDLFLVWGWGGYITQVKNKSNGNFRRYSRNGLDVLPQMLFPPTGHIMSLTRIFFRYFLIPTAGQVCSTGGLPMAMNGIVNNLPSDFSHRWPRIDRTWPSVGSMELTWSSVRCNGVSVRVEQ